MSSQDFSYDVDDHDEEEELEILNSGGNNSNSSQMSGILLPKKSRVKGPMDLFVAPKANPHKEGKIVKDVDLLCRLLDDMVELVGGKTVVQVVTYNASNYIKAGKMLQVKMLQSQVGRAVRAHDPFYLTRASRNPSSAFVKGKDFATSSATFTLRSAHQALSHHDDKVEEDIGEDGDYRLDGDDYCEDGGDLE
ncbi:hypothetical protein V6N11_012560 [Hibiscus sabdariffa]|uniref:DUF659 domain-containing protein n=1 Tax=Hibiscus sabdariffa TaxID=183260 RepID=A0ABR2QBH5_9ROSI